MLVGLEKFWLLGGRKALMVGFHKKRLVEGHRAKGVQVSDIEQLAHIAVAVVHMLEVGWLEPIELVLCGKDLLGRSEGLQVRNADDSVRTGSEQSDRGQMDSNDDRCYVEG